MPSSGLPAVSRRPWEAGPGNELRLGDGLPVRETRPLPAGLSGPVSSAAPLCVVRGETWVRGTVQNRGGVARRIEQSDFFQVRNQSSRASDKKLKWFPFLSSLVSLPGLVDSLSFVGVPMHLSRRLPIWGALGLKFACPAR